jgi:hypothetical protein
MCYSRRLRDVERDQQFEEEVRFLFDRESKRPEPPAPVVEHDDEDPVVESPPTEVVASQV